MTRWSRRPFLVLALLVLLPAVPSAHVFFSPYTLPVPFWIYLYACAATLIVSFAVIGYFVGAQMSPSTYPMRDLLPAHSGWQVAWRWVRIGLRAGSLGLLALTVVAGLIGTGDPLRNINVTLFWVAFLLGFTYLTAVLGDLFAVVSPWKLIVRMLEAMNLDLSSPRLSYPTWLGYLPAVAFYMLLIWLELFTFPRPQLLSIVLLIYTALTIAGAACFGKEAWFGYAEVFGVFFRVVGTIAPILYLDGTATRPARIVLRPPFVGTLQAEAKHPTLVLFVLFMLSSTTYDAIHETLFWVSVYWQTLVPWFEPLWGGDLGRAQGLLTSCYVVYQQLGLVLSPFFYLLVYVTVMVAARAIIGTKEPVIELASHYVLSLVPIALVYHATHYATIVMTQLPVLTRLSADPFGWDWNASVARAAEAQAPLNMGLIWHTQVVLMLLGHVAAVYLAHVMTLKMDIPSGRSALSQIPVLVLMVGYTCFGLWVLSLPLALPQVLAGD